jgi:hypothetical protein
MERRSLDKLGIQFINLLFCLISLGFGAIGIALGLFLVREMRRRGPAIDSNVDSNDLQRQVAELRERVDFLEQQRSHPPNPPQG